MLLAMLIQYLKEILEDVNDKFEHFSKVFENIKNNVSLLRYKS